MISKPYKQALVYVGIHLVVASGKCSTSIWLCGSEVLLHEAQSDTLPEAPYFELILPSCLRAAMHEGVVLVCLCAAMHEAVAESGERVE